MNMLSLIKNLNLEQKAGVFFAATAFFFSLVLGMAFGVGAGTVFLRTGLLTAVFAALGFGIIEVLKRFVPELYAVLSEARIPETERGPEAAVSAEGQEIADSGMKEEVNPAGTEEAPKGKSAFTELSNEDFAKLAGTIDGSDSKKMGKHIISNEKIVSYEPKIMAQAVRTMMRRDED